MGFSHRALACLTGLPTEILLDVYQHLDLGSIFEFSLANKSFFDFFEQHKAAIVLPVLIREFSPFDELLQIYTASAEDLDVNSGRYKPRRVVFRRFPGDTGQVLAPRPAAELEVSKAAHGFTPITKDRRHNLASDSVSRTVVLTERDINPILKQCRTVKEWERLFPQMRFYHEAENCRSLRPHESPRFRRALYRWWLYGIYFHGDFPRPRAGLPEPNVDDIRTSQMRYHSTSELLEMMDLVETMKDIILQYICPRLDPTQHDSFEEVPLVENMGRGYSLSTSWTDQSRWGRIVKTYAKLGPKELMYYYDNIFSYPRKRLITEIRLQYPNFTLDQESIQMAIRCALDEREWLAKVPSLAEDSVGGILDFDDERDEERVAYGADGSPDGSLPLGSKYVRSQSMWSPRGDDGSYLEEHSRQMAFGDRVTTFGAMGPVRP